MASLTYHSQINDIVSCWRPLEVDSTPVPSLVGQLDGSQCQRRVLRVLVEAKRRIAAAAEPVLVVPVPLLVRIITVVQTETSADLRVKESKISRWSNGSGGGGGSKIVAILTLLIADVINHLYQP